MASVPTVNPLKNAFRSDFGALCEGARGHVVAVVGEFLDIMCVIFFAFTGGESAAASSHDSKHEVGISTTPAGLGPALLMYTDISAGFRLPVFVGPIVVMVLALQVCKLVKTLEYRRSRQKRRMRRRFLEAGPDTPAQKTEPVKPATMKPQYEVPTGGLPECLAD
ncbi:hypothetical protein BJ875DRAFT_482023 [Amylocarpus encephaloides]|uniref:Transmembrane protein n=1 Tax=Amylocarpus encephaloides TaxID=45428 RepID=A0A9P7YNZ1_9HELO|nr:hypothetical protein BJ875DRAFT_482023 [Amylocarpus encephaloides]